MYLQKRKEWLRRIDKEPSDKHQYRICQLHFIESDLKIVERIKKLKLQPLAIPRLHLPQYTKATGKVIVKSQSLLQYSTGQKQFYSSHYTSSKGESSSAFITESSIPFAISHVEHDFKKEDYEKRISSLENANAILNSENERLKIALKSFLNDDQLESLEKGKNHRMQWSNEAISKSYTLRLTCGTTGYDLLRELGYPLLTIRTLNKRVEHLKLCPGLLNEVFQMLKIKCGVMKKEEKFCMLLLDEMTLVPKSDFDASTGLVFGKPTVPNSRNLFDEHATHGLLYMLAGVSSRWKQIVGYQFTSNSFNAKAVKDDILNIIYEAEHLDLKVVAVLSDMSGQNRGLWKLFDINAGKYSALKNCCPHPCSPDRKLYFSPDPPHILKNLRDHLTNRQDIIIPSDFFVKKYNLPNNIVSIKHIAQLLEIEKQSELKIAPYLKDNCVNPSHYEKMKVNLAISLLHHDTGAGLRYYVEKNKLDQEVLTTAWFCEFIFNWFTMLSSRTKALAPKNGKQYQQDVEFLEEVIELFYHIKIGEKNCWKPVQTGVILATKNAIELANYFLNEEHFHFLCLGRFTQDAIENSFSVIRCIQPVSSPKEFKMAVRLITVSQFNRPIRRGNYETSDAEYLADFLNKNIKIANKDTGKLAIEDLAIDFCKKPNDDELQSLYYLAGRTVNQVIKTHKIQCPTCIKAIKTQKFDPIICELVELTALKAYSENLVYVTKSLFEILHKAEEFLRKYETCLLKGETKIQIILNNFIQKISTDLPKCHDITNRIVSMFYKTRIHFLTRDYNKILQDKLPKNQRCDSRSVGMRRAVQNIR